MEKVEVESIFDKFNQFNILIIGDVMIDTYFWGKVERISPEAPVPIISRTKIENRLGGAANVALNIKSLGARPILCTVIGKDDKAEIFKDLLLQSQMVTDGILQQESRMTTVKTRVMSDNHHLLRIDEEMTKSIGPEIEALFIQKISDIISENQVNAIIFQDYDKGVITPGKY